MKKNLTIPEYMIQSNLCRLRRDEWSLLLQVALLNAMPFYPSTFNKIPNKYYQWSNTTLVRLEGMGIINKRKDDCYDCDLQQIKDIVHKFESTGRFGLKPRQMPLVKLAFYIQGQGDYYQIPSAAEDDPVLKEIKKYIATELLKSESLDLFTIFEKEGDRFLILKKKALEIIDVYKSVDSFIKTCKSSIQKKHYSSNALQNVWNTPILGDR